MNDSDWLFLGFAIGVLFYCGFFLFIFMGDDMDAVDVRYLGQKMCAEHQLEYNYRTIDDNGRNLIIYCKKPSENIEDGYLKTTTKITWIKVI